MQQELQELQFWWNLKLYTNRKPWNQWWQIFLWFLMSVNIGTCHLSGHSFEPKMANLPILMTFCTLRKPSVVNSMVTIVFLWFLTPANIDNCQYWYLFYSIGTSFRPQFLTNTVNAPALIKFCSLLKIKTWNQKVNLVSKILLLHYKQNW